LSAELEFFRYFASWVFPSVTGHQSSIVSRRANLRTC